MGQARSAASPAPSVWSWEQHELIQAHFCGQIFTCKQKEMGQQIVGPESHLRTVNARVS